MEEWRTVVTDNGEIWDNYEVSNLGRVRNKKTGKVLRPREAKDYLRVALYKNNKSKDFSVHRLVAFAFVENDDIESKIQVNHIDENKQNNVWINLEWCTRKENMNYGTRNERAGKNISKAKKGRMIGKDHPNARKVICLETSMVFDCIKDACKWCGKKSVRACCKGRAKTCGGYHWMYYDEYLEKENLD